MDSFKQLVTCPDGRALEVATVGDPSGATVYFHHGAPGSIKSVRSFAALAEGGELFIVTTSRPGYGTSTRLDGRNAAAVVDDVATVLDALGREDYVALGWSGGGPHAFACGVLDAPRCRKVVSLASVVPLDADIDWTDGMGPENLEEFALAKEGGVAYEEALEAVGAFMAAMDKDNVIEMMGGLLGTADRAVLVDEDVRARFAEGMSYGVATTWRGYYDDNVLFYQPWGFSLTDLTVPVALYYGDDDRMVPPSHGAWLSSQLSNATTHHYRDEGHFSIFANHVDEIRRDLVSAFAAISG